MLLALCLLSTACATSKQSRYFINEILIKNNGSESVRDVTIRNLRNGLMFSCGNVSPSGICSNRFARRDYAENPVEISRNYGNRPRRTEQFVVPVPREFDPGTALTGVLAILLDGRIRAYLDQTPPQY